MIGNPTVHPAPGATVSAYSAGMLVGSAVADSLGRASVPVPAAGTYTMIATDPDGKLSGTVTQSYTCNAGYSSILMTPTMGFACLPGVFYRPLQTTLVLTDAQATRSIIFGQNLRGTTGAIWDNCSLVSSTHKFFGPFTGQDEDCSNVGTGDVRMVYEFGSRFDNVSGFWQPALAQIWKALACSQPNKYPIYGGGSCPPPNPAGVADFTSSSARVATSWSPGPPFTATFEFPAFAFTLGSTISEYYLPMAGTVTISEVP